MFEGKHSTSNICTFKQVFKWFHIRLSPNDSFVETLEGSIEDKSNVSVTLWLPSSVINNIYVQAGVYK